mmetsp:Transcript_16662/g.11817  ORF Transcript_16662/g.11817 Transcript_16662/m.11817 type:complete len:167 (-) Transcript_16662:691-1191(-)
MKSHYSTIILDILSTLENYSNVHDELVVETFSYVCRNEMLDLALFVWMMSDALLIKKSFTCLQGLVYSFKMSCNMVLVKTYLLNKFMKNMTFKQVISFIEIVEAILDGKKEDSFLARNLNPIQAGLLMIDVCRNLSIVFPATKFRAKKIEENLQEGIFRILKFAYN